MPHIDRAFEGLDGRLLASAIDALRVDIARLREEALATSLTTDTSVEPEVVNNAGTGGNGNGHDTVAAPGNGNGHRSNEGESQESEPVQDEWGFYNPERCGMQALMAKLEAGDAAAAKAPAVPRPAGTGAAAGNGHRTTPKDLKRLAPLAMWARAGDVMNYAIENALSEDPLARLASAVTAGLPEHVAAVRYGSGCRIRRVRVVPQKKKPSKDKRQVVIVSRKALDELR